MARSRTLAPALLVLTGALVAAAPVAAQSTGPLTLQPISSTFVVAPEVKVTSINDKTGVLTGAYAGRLIENRVLLGGGVYWLAEPRDQARLFYVGFLSGARLLGGDRFNIMARALVGVGSGTAYDTVTVSGVPPRHFGRPFVWDGSGTFRVGYRDDFALFEPELRASLHLNDVLSVNLGAGYRVTSADGWLNDAFKGATGSVGVQFAIGR